MNRLITILGSLFTLALCILSACSPGQPVIDPAAIYTHSVQTVEAQLTLTAAAAPYTPTFSSTPEITVTAQNSGTASGSETPTPTASSTAFATIPGGQGFPCNSKWVRDIGLQDFEEVPAGSQFVKTWLVKNTGSCTWTTAFQIIYGYGEQMNGQNTYLPRDVYPGEEVEISVVMTAPTSSGNHGGYWRLATNNLVPFGDWLTLVIVVP